MIHFFPVWKQNTKENKKRKFKNIRDMCPVWKQNPESYSFHLATNAKARIFPCGNWTRLGLQTNMSVLKGYQYQEKIGKVKTSGICGTVQSWNFKLLFCQKFKTLLFKEVPVKNLCCHFSVRMTFFHQLSGISLQKYMETFRFFMAQMCLESRELEK